MRCALARCLVFRSLSRAAYRGLGKTIQAIALSWTLLSALLPLGLIATFDLERAEQNPYYGSSSVIDRVLVVCPVTLVKVNFVIRLACSIGMNESLAELGSRISEMARSRQDRCLRCRLESRR